MKKNTIRIPKQERSIQKKAAIIQAAFELFSRKGYYNTDTVEIAKEAKVSTGIVYSYFKDKKEILDVVIDRYLLELEERLLQQMNQYSKHLDMNLFINKMIETLIDSHHSVSKAQNQFMALSLLDEEIYQKFYTFKLRIIRNIQENNLNDTSESAFIKIHLAYEFIERVSHLFVNGEISSAQLEEYKRTLQSSIMAIMA